MREPLNSKNNSITLPKLETQQQNLEQDIQKLQEAIEANNTEQKLLAEIISKHNDFLMNSSLSMTGYSRLLPLRPLAGLRSTINKEKEALKELTTSLEKLKVRLNILKLQQTIKKGNQHLRQQKQSDANLSDLKKNTLSLDELWEKHAPIIESVPTDQSSTDHPEKRVIPKSLPLSQSSVLPQTNLSLDFIGGQGNFQHLNADDKIKKRELTQEGRIFQKIYSELKSDTNFVDQKNPPLSLVDLFDGITSPENHENHGTHYPLGSLSEAADPTPLAEPEKSELLTTLSPIQKPLQRNTANRRRKR